MTRLASWLRRFGALGAFLALFALTPAIAHQHEPHTPQQQRPKQRRRRPLRAMSR